MLDRIVTATKDRVADLRSRRAAVMERAESASDPPSFEAVLRGSGLKLIAEVKRRSPSRGELAPSLDPALQAAAYARGGAAAISVLTEPQFFAGHPDDLLAAREASGLPVLRKDFVVESIQVWESRAIGASAVLLIVAALTPNELVGLISDVERAGLAALVEVHDREEVRIALDAGARIIGVNNRDLSTFAVSLETAELLAPELAGPGLTVAESGIWTRADARRMAACGYNAILVGEALVTSADPAALITDLVS
ncbi:MAG TPA: indole-3-glycerol phosphate synthase TrpC [Acidimicrobiia bacterium]|nr:indole-3-glycerol phosphate synthase TrpC [Acidimicrobiia bacterium]